ncbi:SDR family oxidoreductase [uncultured Pseudodesulfovibrio sp.]|uniref:SDR family NAD(P)-dependent oxidoreductase n=1 Tax=uncultured Pseudodesulfovibrio sp. TaxID=2035858 RepID=UPI0029C7CE71|nr:SDR family oxidoreductase [uncultured Pseudodesulfovibrio sp.]
MKDTHVLVIGGTHGGGRELVKLLSSVGGRVSVVGRREPREDDAALPGVKFIQADITDAESGSFIVDSAVAANGPLNGVAFFQRFRGDGDDWEKEIAVSLTATRDIIDAAIPRFSADGPKSIVAISSIAGQFVASEQPLSYHMGKSGIEQIVRYYAVTLGSQGIRVNCVRPGSVLKEESKSFYYENRPLMELYEKLTPLGRMGTSEELAKVVRFLLSGDASFVTGQTMTVDGGVSLQWPEGLCRELAGLDMDVTRKK